MTPDCLLVHPSVLVCGFLAGPGTREDHCAPFTHLWLCSYHGRWAIESGRSPWLHSPDLAQSSWLAG